MDEWLTNLDSNNCFILRREDGKIKAVLNGEIIAIIEVADPQESPSLLLTRLLILFRKVFRFAPPNENNGSD